MENLNIVSKNINDEVSHDEFNSIVGKVNELVENATSEGSTLNEHIQDSDIHFTTEERQKLNGIEAEANKYEHPEHHSPDIISETEEKQFIGSASKTAISNHINDGDIHVTTQNKSDWNGKAEGNHNHNNDYEPKNSNIQTHIGDNTIHPTAEKQTAWDGKAEGNHNHNNDYEPKNSNIQTHISDSTIHPTALKQAEWDAKSNFSGSYNDLSNKPDLSLKADLVAGKIPASQLPSYVDDVLDGRRISDVVFNDLNGDPYTPESNKLYLDTTDNIVYRWSGTVYVAMGSANSLALGETESTAYRGDRGKTAYDHSQTTHAPADAQKNSDILKSEIEAKLIGEISTHTHPAGESGGGVKASGYFTYNGTDLVFTIAQAKITSDTLLVEINGILQKETTDFTITGTTLTIVDGSNMVTGDVIGYWLIGSVTAPAPEWSDIQSKPELYTEAEVNTLLGNKKTDNVSAPSRILGRKTAGSGAIEELTLSELLDFIGSAAEGDILYRGSSAWQRLAKGTAGQILTMNAGATAPSWVNASGGSSPAVYQTASSFSTSSTSAVDITGLSTSVSANKKYKITIAIIGYAVSPNGITVVIPRASGTSLLSGYSRYGVSGGTVSEGVISKNSSANLIFINAIANGIFMFADFYLEVGSTAGTFKIQCYEGAGGGGSVYINNGSYFAIQEVQ